MTYQEEKRLLHGGDYNPDQWLAYPDILAQDIALMQASKVNTVSVGIFAWSALEPREGEFHFDWLDKIFDDVLNLGDVTLSMLHVSMLYFKYSFKLSIRLVTFLSLAFIWSTQSII